MLLLTYSLFRWGSGREAAIGLAIIVVGILFPSTVVSSVGEAAVAILFLLFPAALGASVRYRANSQLREEDQARLLEREQLARELHDTVAHHVSAIAIQAQAGRALAASSSNAAVGALEVIEDEASRTLAEMPAMVAPSVKAKRPTSPRNEASPTSSGSLTAPGTDRGSMWNCQVTRNLPPSVEAANYRLAQESLTKRYDTPATQPSSTSMSQATMTACG